MPSFTGGAPAVVAQVLTTLLTASSNAADAAKTAGQTAINMAVAPTLAAPPRVALPAALSAPTMNATKDPITEYNTLVTGLRASLGSEFDAFTAAYFPTTLDGKMQAWLTAALAGGTGINPVVEDQLWARERTRTLREAARATEEAATTWLGRGFAMPPGALVHQAVVIDREAQEKISESSRERAIKTWETEVENLRLAVGKTMELRNSALDATRNFMMSVIVPSEQVAGSVGIAAADARIKMVSALVDLYRAQAGVNADMARIDTSNAELVERGFEAKLRSETDVIGHRAAAAVAIAQSLGSQAAAALNGMHAQGTVSGSDSTQTVIQG
jgi:hypothetical protein